MGSLRMTLATQHVLSAFLDDPGRPLYGLQVCEAAGLPSGTIHPILARLERVGWLTSSWEELDPSEAGRPRRRYYKLDPNSIAVARSALARSQSTSAGRTGFRPGLAGSGS